MGKRTNGGSGKQPTGQTSRGYPDLNVPNRKNSQSQRPDVIGMAPDQGGAALRGSGREVTSTNYSDPLGGPNTFDHGTDSLPGPDTLPRGYTTLGTNAPSPSRNTSANRQRFGIDPGEVTQPDGDTTKGPQRPHFGVGTTGE